MNHPNHWAFEMFLHIENIFILLIFFFSLPIFFLCLQVLFALPKYSAKRFSFDDLPSYVILIPAHNEAVTIQGTVQQIIETNPKDVRILVVADNCTDNTADLARQSGAEVIERHNLEERGKGFALSYGVEYLKSSPPEVVIIVDADCAVHEQTIENLLVSVKNTDRTSQALYLMKLDEEPSLNQQVSAFAFILKNHVRLLGLKRMGVPCHLVGTGMAFPWDVISTAELATGNIVEDMQLGVDLVKEGKPAVFCPEALVTSKFPESNDALDEQKKRWVHGHLQTIFSEVPKLAIFSLSRFNISALLFALDLAIPPLSLAIYFLCFWGAVALVGLLFGMSFLPIIFVFFIGSLFVFSILLSWFFYGRDVLSPGSLLAVFGYIFRKFPLLLSFISKRQKNWVRTDRN